MGGQYQQRPLPRLDPPTIRLVHMKRILITGKNGRVCHELTRVLAPLGELIALDRSAMDLADADAVPSRLRAVLDRIKPANSASY